MKRKPDSSTCLAGVSLVASGGEELRRSADLHAVCAQLLLRLHLQLMAPPNNSLPPNNFSDDVSIFRADSKKKQLDSSKQSKASGGGGPYVPPFACSS